MQIEQHYENFPVASWLCPPALRPPIVAIYRFARCADDIADEGSDTADTRLATLAAYAADLTACQGTGAHSGRWPQVFDPLRRHLQQHALPVALLADLLDAFMQDVRYTRDGRSYADMAELMDYCRRSANPVGRLLLHLHGVGDATALRQSDQICSALQLINFWQDLGVDLARQRHYLPEDLCRQFGVDPQRLLALPATEQAQAQALVAELCRQARALMLAGAPLVHRLPGRSGWELRLVVQGGLRILDRLAAGQHRPWRQRPKLSGLDLPRLLWRAWRMPRLVSRPASPSVSGR